MRTATAVLLATLMLLCAGLSAVLVLNAQESEPNYSFLACFSGDTPVFAGKIRGTPETSGLWISFYSVEHGSVVEVVNTPCVVYNTAP